MSDYVEIEVNVIGRDGNIEPYNFNRSNVNYYRPYVESDDQMGTKPKLMTMVYMKGSTKAIQVQCSREEFKRKMNSPSVSTEGLNWEQRDKVLQYIAELQVQ